MYLLVSDLERFFGLVNRDLILLVQLNPVWVVDVAVLSEVEEREVIVNTVDSLLPQPEVKHHLLV